MLKQIMTCEYFTLIIPIILFQKKTDREEIRKRLVEGYHNSRMSTKKSSLESRIQNGKLSLISDKIQ